MKMIRLIADTLNGGSFTPYTRYPATEDDRTYAILDYGRWANNPIYKNWRIELCNAEIVDDEPVVSGVIKSWPVQ